MGPLAGEHACPVGERAAIERSCDGDLGRLTRKTVSVARLLPVHQRGGGGAPSHAAVGFNPRNGGGEHGEESR